LLKRFKFEEEVNLIEGLVRKLTSEKETSNAKTVEPESDLQEARE